MQGIGIGISDFKMLRMRDNYFIDKSLFIKHIIDNQSGVTLITIREAKLLQLAQMTITD